MRDTDRDEISLHIRGFIVHMVLFLSFYWARKETNKPQENEIYWNYFELYVLDMNIKKIEAMH